MNEREGCAVLETCFREAGLDLERDYPFDEHGVKVNLDGYDPARRIGFEFITTEAGDRAEFTDAVVAMLERRMAKGELYLLLVDEHEALTPEALRFAASGFLSRLREQRKLR